MTTTVTVARGGDLDGWPTRLGLSDDNIDDALFYPWEALERAVSHLVARRKFMVPGPIGRVDFTAARTFKFYVPVEPFSAFARLVVIYSTTNDTDTLKIVFDTPAGDNTIILPGTADPDDDRAPAFLDSEYDGGVAGDFGLEEVSAICTPSNTNTNLSAGATIWSMRIIVFPMDEIEV
jgi:hypothetical protein